MSDTTITTEPEVLAESADAAESEPASTAAAADEVAAGEAGPVEGEAAAEEHASAEGEPVEAAMIEAEAPGLEASESEAVDPEALDEAAPGSEAIEVDATEAEAIDAEAIEAEAADTLAPVAGEDDEPSDGAATPRPEMEAALEAVLFVASEPQPRERLLDLFGRGERAEAAAALEAVLDRYRGGEGRGVMVEEVAGGVRLVSRPELHGYLRRFFQVTGRSRLSMAALETLAIIAYRQPLTGPEIGELRGVQSNAVLRTLLERRLIRIAGRKQVVGKPFLYATTREFLQHFGFGSLADLPPLEEMESLFDAELGGGAGPDREEEVLRANAELDARESEAEPEGAEEES